MIGRYKAKALLVVLLPFAVVLSAPSGWASAPNWMLRPGTAGHALSLSDGSRVYLDAVIVEKIKHKQNIS